MRSTVPAVFAGAFHGSDLWAGHLALFSYWLLLVPAVVGGVALRRRRVPIYPILAFVATVVISVAMTFGDTRYRAAADVSILLLAEIGIDDVIPVKRSPSSTGSEWPDTEQQASGPLTRSSVTVMHGMT